MKRILPAACALLLFGVSSGQGFAQQYKGPVIDAHAHIRFGDTDALKSDQPIGTEKLRQLDAQAGIGQSALIVIAAKGQPEQTRANNDKVLAVAAASQGRFYAVPSVHPLDGEAALEELRRLAKLGVHEIKLHPNSQNFDVSDPAIGTVADECGKLGIAILFDSYKPWDPSQPGKFLLLAVQHPQTHIVLAHMFFSQFREALTFAQMSKLGMATNVSFDLSAIAAAYQGSPVVPELVWTIRKIGVDHFLFGSDWPVDNPGDALKAVRSMGFTAQEEQAILHDNAAKLLGLK
ncbi:amidohydrolase family protein [Terriglobus sp. ADX1]|uniref:amidohydrolase family protein n=1 Tax=Terriglobus sp. ADX1 TaxID=2794063 RepID=UPI002FE53F0F